MFRCCHRLIHTYVDYEWCHLIKSSGMMSPTSCSHNQLYIPICGIFRMTPRTWFFIHLSSFSHLPWLHILNYIQQPLTKELPHPFLFSLWGPKIYYVHNLKENIVMLGPIFIVFSLPPSWPDLWPGSFHPLQTVASPSMTGVVFSFVTRSLKCVQKCVFICNWGALKKCMWVFLFPLRKKCQTRIFVWYW